VVKVPDIATPGDGGSAHRVLIGHLCPPKGRIGPFFGWRRYITATPTEVVHSSR